ncbi:hypothetical protein JNUCC74_04590 [Cerasibacillus sp. JNUCC 74]
MLATRALKLDEERFKKVDSPVVEFYFSSQNSGILIQNDKNAALLVLFRKTWFGASVYGESYRFSNTINNKVLYVPIV